MSEVDLARQRMGDKDFVRFVVIKRIKTDRSADKSFIRMFKDEARITSELHHECIGQVYDFGRQGDEYYLALEYVPGVDVRGIINTLRERGQRVPIRVALRILCDVLDGLDYAHRKRDAFGHAMKIVHRDVNPRNIMVSIHGETKLIDFGVAKASGRLERTKTDHVKGKFSYMAPEQITGESIDHRADLFAVGLTLHEFIAGYGPFYGLNQVQIVHRLLHGQVPEMPAVRDLPDDAELRRVHDKALAPDPNKRYATATEFRKDLEAIADSVGGLPSREQIARFLQKVDPQLNEKLQEKMRVYAGELDLTTEAGVARPVAIVSEEVSGTMDSAVSVVRQPPMVPEHTGSQYTATQTMTGVVAGGIVGGTVFGLAFFAVVVVLGGILLWLFPPFQPVARNPEPIPDAIPLDVEPVPQPTTEPAPTPGPTAAPDPTPSPKPQPVRPRPTRPRPVVPDPTPVPEPEPQPEPEPEPQPQPVVPAPTPQPTPKPQPTVDPSLFGTLSIASDPRGKLIKVDGTPRGSTPQQLRLPPGTYTVEVEGYPAKTVRVSSQQMTPAVFK
ncbi:MAG: protein kinase [Alphaproteobacteria bacterium]|nr:protein kinase [Alphaproteobacteria bacterium]